MAAATANAALEGRESKGMGWLMPSWEQANADAMRSIVDAVAVIEDIDPINKFAGELVVVERYCDDQYNDGNGCRPRTINRVVRRYGLHVVAETPQWCVLGKNSEGKQTFIPKDDVVAFVTPD